MKCPVCLLAGMDENCWFDATREGIEARERPPGKGPTIELVESWRCALKACGATWTTVTKCYPGNLQTPELPDGDGEEDADAKEWVEDHG